MPVVYNTGGYERLETLRQLEGLIDIYLPDFKYTRPAKAAAYSAAPDYVERVGPALLEMRRQVQDRWDGDKMLSGMIVRHLILPGNTNSAIEALDWLHSHLPGTYVSLMAQYTPMPGLPGADAHHHPPGVRQGGGSCSGAGYGSCVFAAAQRSR